MMASLCKTIAQPFCRFKQMLGRKYMDNQIMQGEIKPGELIPSDAVLYAINCTMSNKKLSYEGGTMTLTAPGTPASVQVISKATMALPGFMSLWSAGEIRVSSNPALADIASKPIVMQKSKEAERMEDLVAMVEHPTDEQPDAKSEDVSDKFHKAMDEQMYIEPSEAESVASVRML